MGQHKTYFSGLKTVFYTSNLSPTWQTGTPMTWPLAMSRNWTKMKLSNQILAPKWLNLGILWYQVSIKSNCITFLNIIKNNAWEFFIIHILCIYSSKWPTSNNIWLGKRSNNNHFSRQHCGWDFAWYQHNYFPNTNVQFECWKRRPFFQLDMCS